jgi:hypothetical protein
MAAKDRRLAGNSKLAAADPLTSLGTAASASGREAVPDEVVSNLTKGTETMTKISLAACAALAGTTPLYRRRQTVALPLHRNG